MNLVIIAAVIAVASADKLDRTYLPPASAKTAGGSPGELQTPFSTFNQGLGGISKGPASAKTAGGSPGELQTPFSTFNQGLGGIPKGGFENDFKGVVVDAASPGIRASGDGETGLGAPRTAYGSTNSKVGDAAFRGSLAGFRTPNQFGNEQTQFGNFGPDGQTAGTSVNAQSFGQNPGQFEQTYQRSQELNARDQNANIVRFDSEVGPESFSYAFETDNGISAEESGVATNGVLAQGGFSYTGDDGQVYSVTYTADEGGYQPKGDHLPTPPPIPEEILKSLEQNARDEAAGLVDDGSYDAQKYNDEGDNTESDGASTYNGRPVQFGNKPQSDVTASGTLINQNNQAFVKPDVNGQAQLTDINTGSALNFAFSPNKFAQAASPSNSRNGFAQSNQGLQNRFQQNRPTANVAPEDSANANTFVNPTFEANPQVGHSQNFIQGQAKPQQSSFDRPQSGSPNSNGQVSAGAVVANNAFRSSENNGNSFGQRQPSGPAGNRIENNEYLPPVNGNNRGPSQAQKPTGSLASQQGFNQFSQTAQRPQDISASQAQKPTGLGSQQGFNQFTQTAQRPQVISASQAQKPTVSETQQGFNKFAQTAQKPQDISASSSAFVSGSQANVETEQPQFGSYQANQFASIRKPVAQTNAQTSFGGSQNTPALSQSSDSFPSFQPLQSTAQPATELTTPFESNPNTQKGTNQQVAFGSFSAQSSQTRPTQSPFGSRPNNNVASQFAAPVSTSASTFASSQSSSSNSHGLNSRPSVSNAQTSSFANQRPQTPSQSKQQNIFSQSQTQNALSDNHFNDAQVAPSTQRPLFSQNFQVQGHDDSYFYNKPSNAFNTPNTQAQASRFPNTPFNQFDRVTQGPTLTSQSNAQAIISQGNFQGNSRVQNGANRFPQPPTLTSVPPTFPTQGSTASVNGITQASASAFTAPTSSTQFGSQSAFSTFGRRPSQQISGQFNSQYFAQSAPNQPGFGRQTTDKPQSLPGVNRNQYQQQTSFQSQQSTNTNLPSSNSGDSTAVTSQQYKGEIYEYTKPTQTLPPPTEEDKKAGFGQFGRQPTQPQQNSQEPSVGQTGPTQSSPQSSPQTFGQKTQISQSQSKIQLNSRPQFGQQVTSSGNIKPTQASSFAQNTNAQKFQSPGNFNTQANLNNQAAQQFNSRPFNNQPAQISQRNQQTGSQVVSSNQNNGQNRNPPCCKTITGTKPVHPTQTNQFSSQNQFGVTDVTAQAFKPDQVLAQSFAGKGEIFGGPRKPPSFDETGYHY